MTTGHAGIPPEIPERAISPPSVVPTPLAWRRAAEWSARFDADPSLGRAPLDHDFVNRPLTESWARLAEASPDRLAVRDARMSLTRRQLVDLTRRIAGAIARTEAAAGPVALLLPDGACYAAALAAGLIAGRIMLLLDDGNPPARNAEIIRDARASLIIVERTDDPIATVIRDLPVLAIGDGRTLAEAGDRLDASRIGLDDPAFIVTTSGSTGRPKLVLHSHRGMAYRAQQFSASMGLTAEDRLLSTTSAIGTYAGINYLFASAYAGAEVHVATIRQIGIRGVFELMRQQRITALRSPPSLLRTLAPLAGADEAFAHVRAIRLAGDQATWDDIAALRRVTPPGCRITNSYGATETVSFNWVAPAEPRSDAIRIPAGVPFAEAEAVVANPDGNPVEPGQEGELFVRSRFAALGEIVDGTPQAGRLIPDPDDPTRRIYATGDLATQTPDVLLVLIGPGIGCSASTAGGWNRSRSRPRSARPARWERSRCCPARPGTWSPWSPSSPRAIPPPGTRPRVRRQARTRSRAGCARICGSNSRPIWCRRGSWCWPNCPACRAARSMVSRCLRGWADQPRAGMLSMTSNWINFS